MFELHPQLAKDGIEVGDLSLSKVLLLNDSQFPWLVLVPRREGIKEIFQLELKDQSTLLEESSAVAEMMADYFKADKMNVAALGNMVPQLHIHHIARYQTDLAWPRPVWGAAPAKPYEEQFLTQRLEQLRQRLSGFGLQYP
ncbi:HIT domain-containing protein [Oceanicoccus sp. KOV_DT_Chl]|uniref:HIT domain-containing protein n=1 Tax=Oceanicoccus sp. KOV_DT_Chl TaxID=1904639 RepID=UPI000C7D2556|nr:HIT domain-containing protein [Oceanicoccus sp. KOV_DT_Chl]